MVVAGAQYNRKNSGLIYQYSFKRVSPSVAFWKAAVDRGRPYMQKVTDLKNQRTHEFSLCTTISVIPLLRNLLILWFS